MLSNKYVFSKIKPNQFPKYFPKKFPEELLNKKSKGNIEAVCRKLPKI